MVLRGGTLDRKTVAAFAYIVLSTALGAAAGCSGSSGDEPRIDASPASAPALPTETAEAGAKAVAAYNGYREAYSAASVKADPAAVELARYVGSPLLRQVRLTLQQRADQGIVSRGRPTWSARVTAVDLTRRPYSVLIEDCFDQSGARSVYKQTGKSAVAPGQVQRYVITSKAELYDDGRWRISTSEAHRDRPC